MDADLQQKLTRLQANLAGIESLAVAFSGGVDSSLLLYLAHQALGERCLAVTARSCSFPQRELAAARQFCSDRGIEQLIVDSEELDIAGFADNPPERCYLCKSELFARIADVAAARGILSIAEGSNLDDEGDYRPGLRAVAECGVLSPLRAVGLDKAGVRSLSQHFGLPTADKPSFACLASRFPYGERITEAGLKRVELAEQFLLDSGLRQVRVRSHGELARIEVDAAELQRFFDADFRAQVDAALQGYGFKFVALDLAGYRTGSMNATL
ncbi:MAG: ATP-dependent sacrificial sulfur transferase LarE [Coriobacteriales bacterium]|nr:ATP-dependent sacrificial sulfur transferase LarE [Coriobacteriales bacterium]